METIVMVFFLFKGLSIIVEKYDGYSKFEKLAATKSMFVYQLSKCRFCLDHHLSIISTLIVGCLVGFELYFLILPIVSASINNVLNDRSKN